MIPCCSAHRRCDHDARVLLPFCLHFRWQHLIIVTNDFSKSLLSLLREPRSRPNIRDVPHLQRVLVVLLAPALAPVSRRLPCRGAAHGSLGIGSCMVPGWGVWRLCNIMRAGWELGGWLVLFLGSGRHWSFVCLVDNSVRLIGVSRCIAC